MHLSYDIPTLVAAETHLGTKLALIVEDLRSPSGVSLGTLLALVAAGTMEKRYAAIGPLRVLPHDLLRASTLIAEAGMPAASQAVGHALSGMIALLAGEA